MSSKKRYSLAVDFYIHAEDDNDAMNQAKKWVETQKQKNDNQAMILSLVSCPFASFDCREIYNITEKKK
tara:strand:+ start:375 stop:581 length:207 start_codon:yes stop_codon:yes gene_type:complete